jgi:hypothetical protein
MMNGRNSDASGVPHSRGLDASPETNFGITPLGEQKAFDLYCTYGFPTRLVFDWMLAPTSTWRTPGSAIQKH